MEQDFIIKYKNDIILMRTAIIRHEQLLPLSHKDKNHKTVHTVLHQFLPIGSED